MTIQVFGLDALRAAVTHGVRTAEYAGSLLDADPAWEVITPARLGVVTFRPVIDGLSRPEVDAVIRALAEDMLVDGHALVLTTDWGDGPVQICSTHPQTTEEDVESTIDRLSRMLARRRRPAP